MSNEHLWATKITANDATAREQLGILRKEWSSADSCFKTYRYMQAASDTTVANGTALGFSDALRQVASLDATNGDYEENQPAGVGIGVITASYYGWIQTGGYHSVVKTDGGDDFNDGDNVILHASSDGVCEQENAGTATDNQLGFAVAADVTANNTVATYLTIAEL